MAGCTLLEKLPRELRDLIYEASLMFEEVTINKSNNRGAYIPGLIRTCKQIRAEASKCFYSKNHFRLITPQTAMFTPVKWLESLPGRHRKHIRNITIHFEPHQYHAGWSFAHAQDQPKHELHNMMVTQSRYTLDKRRVETFELLEQLATTQHLRRKIIAFGIAGTRTASCHVWVHELRSRILETPKQFADDRGLAQICTWC